jgi:hypothetical protein
MFIANTGGEAHGFASLPFDRFALVGKNRFGKNEGRGTFGAGPDLN